MRSIKGFMVILVIYFVSMFQSCSEIRLSLGGTTDKATIDEIFAEVKKGSMQETGRYKVTYFFHAKESEGPREMNGSYYTSRAGAAKHAPGDKVDILYLESNPHIHRLDGERHWLWVGAFFVMTFVSIGYLVWVIKADKDF